jgi:hypothetical protein
LITWYTLIFYRGILSMRNFILVLCLLFTFKIHANGYEDQFSSFQDAAQGYSYYVSKSADFKGLYFVMEKVNQNNLRFWGNYMYIHELYLEGILQYINSAICGVSNDEVEIGGGCAYEYASKGNCNETKDMEFYLGLNLGLRGMTAQFGVLGRQNTELWVVYATSDYQQIDKVKKIQAIEMAVTVTTANDEVPVVTHMGIARSPFHLMYSKFLTQGLKDIAMEVAFTDGECTDYEYIIGNTLNLIADYHDLVKKNGASEEVFDIEIDDTFFEKFDHRLKMHRGLSMYLHSFAAKITQTIYDGKKWMTTTPVGPMAAIMMEVLGEDAVRIGGDATVSREYPWFYTPPMIPKPELGSSYVSIRLQTLADEKPMEPVN